MKNKFFVVLLVVVLALTAVLFVACNKAPTAEYCTVTVYGYLASGDPYIFKVVKGQTFILAQVFQVHKFPLFNGAYNDLCALSWTPDGYNLYNENNPVENDMTLYIVYGFEGMTVRLNVVAKSDRLKAQWAETHNIDEYKVGTEYLTTAYIRNDNAQNLTNETFAMMLGLESTDFQFQILGFETIFNSIDEWRNLVFDFVEYDDLDPVLYDKEYKYFCTPNRHFHIPNVTIYLY